MKNKQLFIKHICDDVGFPIFLFSSKVTTGRPKFFVEWLNQSKRQMILKCIKTKVLLPNYYVLYNLIKNQKYSVLYVGAGH